MCSCGGDDDDSGIVGGQDGVVTTNEATNVSVSEATLTGTVSPNLLTNVSQYGVGYGENEDADDEKLTTNSITGTTFSVTLSGLSSVMTYYYKAFIRDNNGNYIYGATRKFTTLKFGGESSSMAGKAVDLGLPRAGRSGQTATLAKAVRRTTASTSHGARHLQRVLTPVTTV